MEQYIDLLVQDGGIDLDAGKQPVLTSDRISIGQDIKHSILESGLARELQGERDSGTRNYTLTKIEMLAEEDQRIVPGSATATEQESQARNNLDVLLTATTYEYGDIEVTL